MVATPEIQQKINWLEYNIKSYPQCAFSLFKNLAVRAAYTRVSRAKLNSLHSSTTETLFAQNNFISILLTHKPWHCKSALFKGQTSKPYKRTGKHSELIKWRITLTVAVLKTLPKIVFKKNKTYNTSVIELTKEHLKHRFLVIKIPHTSASSIFSFNTYRIFLPWKQVIITISFQQSSFSLFSNSKSGESNNPEITSSVAQNKVILYWWSVFGLTENDGPIMHGAKMQDMKLLDQKWRQVVKLHDTKYSICWCYTTENEWKFQNHKQVTNITNNHPSLSPASRLFSVCAQADELSPFCFELQHSSNQRYITGYGGAMLNLLNLFSHKRLSLLS